jgi:hypothetical protein
MRARSESAILSARPTTADDARRGRREEEAETSGPAADDARRGKAREAATWGLGCGVVLA